MFCEKCGNSIAQGISFCSNCGHPVNNAPQQSGVPQQYGNQPQQYGNQPQYAPQFNPYQQMQRRGGVPKLAIILGSVAAAVVILVVILVAVNRTGGNIEGNIVGTWEQPGLFGLLNSQYVFRADNTGSRTILGLSDNFTWSLDGNRLTLRFAFHTESYTISISGNTLTFRDGTVPGVHRYDRVR